MLELSHCRDASSAPRLPGVERRARMRYSSPQGDPCDLIGPQHDTWVPAVVHNVSTSGIGLALAYPLEPGTPVALDLEGVFRLLLARVVCATPQSGGSWIIGCEFDSELSHAELQAIF